MERFWQNKGVVLPLLGGIIFYQLFASIPQSNTGKCFTLLDGWKCTKYWTAGFWPIWFRELVERVLLPRLVDLQYLTGQQCNGGLAQSCQHLHSEHLPFCICMYSTTLCHRERVSKCFKSMSSNSGFLHPEKCLPYRSPKSTIVSWVWICLKIIKHCNVKQCISAANIDFLW